MTGRRTGKQDTSSCTSAMFTLSVKASGESAALRFATKRMRGVMAKDVPQAARMMTCSTCWQMAGRRESFSPQAAACAQSRLVDTAGQHMRLDQRGTHQPDRHVVCTTSQLLHVHACAGRCSRAALNGRADLNGQIIADVPTVRGTCCPGRLRKSFI